MATAERRGSSTFITHDPGATIASLLAKYGARPENQPDTFRFPELSGTVDGQTMGGAGQLASNPVLARAMEQYARGMATPSQRELVERYGRGDTQSSAAPERVATPTQTATPPSSPAAVGGPGTIPQLMGGGGTSVGGPGTIPPQLMGRGGAGELGAQPLDMSAVRERILGLLSGLTGSLPRPSGITPTATVGGTGVIPRQGETDTDSGWEKYLTEHPETARALETTRRLLGESKQRAGQIREWEARGPWERTKYAFSPTSIRNTALAMKSGLAPAEQELNERILREGGLGNLPPLGRGERVLTQGLPGQMPSSPASWLATLLKEYAGVQLP